MKEIYILGIGHNTPVFIELAEACDYTIVGLYHYNIDRTGEVNHGYKVLGSYDDLWAKKSLKGMHFALSQGDNTIRTEIFNRIISMGGEVPTMIHPKANVSRFAKLGQGTIIHVGTVIHPDVTIGDNTIISYNSSITHSTNVGDNCYVAFGAMIGAYVNIANDVFIGIGANIISGKVKSIGQGAYVGAGALVTKDVNPYTVVAGFPAKAIKRLAK